MPRDQFVRRTNAELICRALHQLDIPAHVNERNDILIHDDKVSGSAYKLVNARAYHHGTMLIDSDLHALGQYLRAPAKNLVSKGVESVRSSVTRLREHSFTVDHMSFCEAAVHEFCRFHGHKSSGPLSAAMDSAVVRYVTSDTASNNPEIRTYEEELRSWEWIYGQTPDFTHRLNWSADASSTTALDIVMKMHRGIITEASVDINGGSTLSENHVALTLRLSECLKGKRYGADGVDAAFEQIRSYGITGVDDVRSWLRSSL
ncbi:Biotin/lipoate A/B protein ligase [Gaertneriomyces sp. JEL0708]|nr:Biotin/lipoate A/B protein ligase [Gaertneriomyces sp. JEL0708]